MKLYDYVMFSLICTLCGTDEGSVLDPETWREYWRKKLDLKKDSEVDHYFSHVKLHFATKMKSIS